MKIHGDGFRVHPSEMYGLFRRCIQSEPELVTEPQLTYPMNSSEYLPKRREGIMHWALS